MISIKQSILRPTCIPVVVEPSEKVCTVPVRIQRLPLSIRPDHIRLVRIHYLIQLRHCLALDTENRALFTPARLPVLQ